MEAPSLPHSSKLLFRVGATDQGRGKEEAEQLGRNSFHYPTIRAQFAIQLQPERVGQAAAEYPRLVSRP